MPDRQARRGQWGWSHHARAAACGRTFAGNSNLPFHSQVEALLASEDYGKDLASVNNLLKKHQLLEADISAHEVSRVAPRQGSGPLYMQK